MLFRSEWTVPVNLGKKINTPYAERTPWLSDDLKYLYLSSNGYKPGKSDLDIYYFVRKDINNWTDWEGPFTLKDINSDQDDWGYKISSTSFQYLARASNLSYESSQKGLNGGFRETNFRPNYLVTGCQSASFKKNQTTDIYYLPPSNTPPIVISDVLFEFNSFKVKKSMLNVISTVADFCKQNLSKNIYIYGYTDEIGTPGYNNDLSKKRANQIEVLLKGMGVVNKINSVGKGISPDFISGKKIESKNKRRVEIYLY